MVVIREDLPQLLGAQRKRVGHRWIVTPDLKDTSGIKKKITSSFLLN